MELELQKKICFLQDKVVASQFGTNAAIYVNGDANKKYLWVADRVDGEEIENMATDNNLLVVVTKTSIYILPAWITYYNMPKNEK